MIPKLRYSVFTCIDRPLILVSPFGDHLPLRGHDVICECSQSGFEVQQSGSTNTHFIDDEGEKGDSCIDIDECDENYVDCPSNSTCLNNPGSYTCECKSGYRCK